MAFLFKCLNNRCVGGVERALGCPLCGHRGTRAWGSLQAGCRPTRCPCPPQVSVYAAPDKIHQAGYALDAAVKLLDFYEDYFSIPYPLPKQGKC